MARDVQPTNEAPAGERVPFRRYIGYFLGLGTWGFGLAMVIRYAPPRLLRRGGTASMLGIAVPFSVLTGTATAGTLVALGLFFLKAGAFIFGSGLAIVPFLREGVVNQRQWRTERQFL